MVISKCKNTNNRVKFISYTGSYPNLCRGTLTLRIDGVECIFEGFGTYETENKYPKFWSSGGYISDYCKAHDGEWEIYVDKLPDKYKPLVYEIDRIFNENVEYGCCGGCI